MKLVVITPPKFFIEEDKILTQLFEEGLDILHIRKPDSSPVYSERLLTLIPKQYHITKLTLQTLAYEDEFGVTAVFEKVE